MRALLSVVIMVVLVVGCGNKARQSAAEQAPVVGTVIAISDSVLNAEMADSVDLGRLRAGEVVEGQFSILNTDTKPFVIMGVETTCGCAQIDYPRQPIKSGESGVFTYRYDSKGQSGWQLKSIEILTSLQPRRFKLYLTAQVE